MISRDSTNRTVNMHATTAATPSQTQIQTPTHQTHGHITVSPTVPAKYLPLFRMILTNTPTLNTRPPRHTISCLNHLCASLTAMRLTEYQWHWRHQRELTMAIGPDCQYCPSMPDERAPKRDPWTQRLSGGWTRLRRPGHRRFLRLRNWSLARPTGHSARAWIPGSGLRPDQN